jgi:phosphoglycolate phosphatase-like HAD superfamily hydrolase
VLLVLWDIDGTLVDSAGHGREAFEDAFAALTGREPAAVEMAGRTDHLIALAMLGDSRSQLPELMDGFMAQLERRKDMIARDGHALPGAEEALRALHGREGVVQSLLTGNTEAGAAVKLGAFGLERWLDLEAGAYGSDPHEARSDLVAVARGRARERYGEPAAIVLVGDTPLDVRAAHEGGARAVAVASGPYGVEELHAAGADEVLPSLEDLGALTSALGIP